jgi:4-azaleucine resistance transporter AzlC
MSNPRPSDGGTEHYTVGDGIRAGLPLLIPVALGGLSFGVLARSLDWGVVAPIVMSLVVFSGSAQFASVGVLAAGGGIGPAIGAATLANLRFLSLGLISAPATRGGKLRRALEGQAVVDASVLIALQDGRVRRGLLFGSSIPQYVGWVGGTAIGAAVGLGSDAEKFGIDVIFPAFFLVLAMDELRRSRKAVLGALLGAAVAGGLLLVTEPGYALLGSTAGALVGALPPGTDAPSGQPWVRHRRLRRWLRREGGR